jgi:ABC-type multidrug transport system fused ATPase/permease subunit
MSAELWRSAPRLATSWALLVTAQALLPVGLVAVTGRVVTSVQTGAGLGPWMVALGLLFAAVHATPPFLLEISQNLGDRTAAALHSRILRAAVQPPGLAHLEGAETADKLIRARDFDLALSGPPLSVAMGLIATGLVTLVTGIGMCLVLITYVWWAAPIVAAGWLATHWLMRDSAVWQSRNSAEVTAAQREADYLYRIAVDSPAAKEMRIFGLADKVVDEFRQRRTHLTELRMQATRLRRGPVGLSLVVVGLAHLAVYWPLTRDLMDGRFGLGPAMTVVLATISAGGVAFGGLDSHLSMFGQTSRSVRELENDLAVSGALPEGTRKATSDLGGHVRFRNVHFTYPGEQRPVLRGFDLDIPAGTSMAIVGVNGAGKTTIVKLLSRMYDPTIGSIEVDGDDLRGYDVASWRSRLTAVYQDFMRLDATLRDNVAPLGAADADVLAALKAAHADGIGALDLRLGHGHRELSGGQWQRIALARALCAVRQGARVAVLDEPTAQLDVRSEQEIFDRLLESTRGCTTVLISHRFSTVRHADRICVVQDGRTVELGTHEELMAAGGLYHEMFELQAARFAEDYRDASR